MPQEGHEICSIFCKELMVCHLIEVNALKSYTPSHLWRVKKATFVTGSSIGSRYPRFSSIMCDYTELRKPAGLPGLWDTLRYVPISQERALWDCPVVSLQLSEPGTEDWALCSLMGTHHLCPFRYGKVPCVLCPQVLPPRGLPSGEANFLCPQSVSFS